MDPGILGQVLLGIQQQQVRLENLIQSNNEPRSSTNSAIKFELTRLVPYKSGDQRAPDEFVEEFETYCRLGNIDTDAQKLQTFRLSLKGDPMVFVSEQIRLFGVNQYDDIVTRFLNKHRPENAKSLYLTELNKRQAYSESVNAFASRILRYNRLFSKVSGLPMKTNEELTLLVKIGLSRDIAVHLASSTCNTLDEIIQLAVDIETARHHERKPNTHHKPQYQRHRLNRITGKKPKRRNITCSTCGYRGHVSRQCRVPDDRRKPGFPKEEPRRHKSQGETGDKRVVMMMRTLPPASAVDPAPTIIHDTILDSGCTEHLLTEETIFDKLVL